MEMMRNGLLEGAKEELELLEYQHPNKFESMKMDLKALIAHLQSHTTSPSPAPSLESSSRRKKRKRSGCVVEDVHIQCRTDVVLHRAQLCLHKIQLLKTSFF